VLAIGGSWGTLSEIALAMRTGVPVVAVGSPIPAGMSVREATSVDEALPLVLDAAQQRR
jgi:predicted Rossmann-fold nucleotide-binding protein